MHETSAPLSFMPLSPVSDRRPLQLGRISIDSSRAVDADTDAAVLHWLSKRNCSASPRQVLVWYGSMCGVSALIAGAFWMLGAALVAPFAGLELVLVGAALWVYARHATDHEHIVLLPGRITVEQVAAGARRRTEFSAAWVRVAPEPAGRRLVELSGEGRRVAVGRFLRADQRGVLADELRWALRQPLRGSTASAAGDPVGPPHSGY